MNASRRNERRVVITGLGLISPLGNTPAALWEALSARRSGIDRLSFFPTDFFPMSFGGEARGFTGAIDDFGPLEGEQKKAIRKGLKTICREAQMGIAAAQRAMFDAGLTQGKFDPERTGVVFGSDYMVSDPLEFADPVRNCVGPQGGFQYARWALDGLAKMNPLWLLKYLPNMPAAHLAIYNDLRGPNNSLTQREASSNLAIGEAFRYVARGSADIIVTGATGTYVHPTKTVQAVLQQELAGNGAEPAQACRPFDRERTGMVLGEGAGALVLESLESAQARGATIYGEVLGAASSTVLDRNRVARRGKALEHVLRGALRDAGASPQDVGHLHAHGVSTRSGDKEEAEAICAVFGPPEKQPPVTAAKSYFGNLGAGSGTIELIASLLALREGRLFPILNYQSPDPDCPINAAASDAVQPGKSFLNVNVSMQGQAACVLIGAA
jgi:3-oxoacyl-[acyl-carrier-protein] synthase II